MNNINTYPYPQNQPNGETINVDYDVWRHNEQAQIDIRKKAAEAQIAVDASYAKNNSALDFKARTLDMMEVYETRKELKTTFITEDSKGYMCLEVSRPGLSNRTLSNPIINVARMSCKQYIANGVKKTDSLFSIRWEGSPDDEVIIPEHDFFSKTLAKELKKAGCSFSICGKDKLDLVIDQLASLLKRNAKKIEIPRTTGWTCMLDGKWVFTEDKSKTLWGKEER